MSENHQQAWPDVPVFDGHNDVLCRLWQHHRPDAVNAFLQGTPSGQLDFPRLRRGNMAGGLFAAWAPGQASLDAADAQAVARSAPHLLSLETIAAARDATFAMLALLLRIEQASQEQIKICRSVRDIRDCMSRGRLAVVMHIEGAEALDVDGELLDILHASGLRSLGPLWSRPNQFGEGVPFRFPSSPDIGNGLTDAGKQLVRDCNRRRILVDLSHMDEKGFWHTAAISDAPLVASHSNAHAISAQSRNLTDRQLAAIAETRGFVGVNFAVPFLREDGRRDAPTSLTEIVRHIEYLLDKVGEDGVGFGSDLDGATMPDDFGDVAGFPRLVAALAARGYSAELLHKICYGNWLRVLEATWGE
ncbi:dipeptidase [Pantoea septica]|uniref:dipeptidase n=2 Tax=Pseudomonadota TaxID=1224 RepID=UPI000534357A|nr:dipeptidase [Pantoea septica]